MNNIVFKNIVKSYGNTKVVKKLDLEIESGERLILLGPSGCGKSTTLRMIAGLEDITSGELYLGDKLANDMTPGQRDIAMVFQNYALLPHLNVWDNIAFGLSNKKLDSKEKEERIKEAIELLNLTGLEKRHPKELSGGQRQRVALARGIVKRAPYFLLDEPLSNLDAQLRTLARSELVKIHEIYKPTFIYVTHDQVEAMTIGQRVAIMNEGYLQQIDTPENIYDKPVNTFVAKFIGSPSMNIVDAKIVNDKIELNGEFVKVPEYWLAQIMGGAQVDLKFGVRPEKVKLSRVKTKDSVEVNISYIENHGNKKCVFFELNGVKVVAAIDSLGDINTTDKFYFEVEWDNVHFFNKEDEKSYGYPWDKEGEAIA
ncbi:MAG: ABC transporter ATP-binding protein [Clostridium sp.]